MLKRFLFALLILPQISFASIKISEIAWMGTADSSSNEWIEIHNDGGESVSLSGYKITSLDDGLNILLKGSIPADSYFLIERTDDSSVPNISADVVASFGSGLSNSGETLRIIDSSGQMVDEIVGGTDWKNIGGNSTSKNTPQWTGSRWVTAIPTPRQALVIDENATDTQQTTDTNTSQTITTTTSSSGSSSSNSSTAKSDVTKKIRDTYRVVIKHDGNIIKNILETFSAKVYGFSDEELPNAKVKWNFGDGEVAEGKEVKHTYRYQGIYSIVTQSSHNDLMVTSHTKVEVLVGDIKIIDAEGGNDGFVKIISQNDINISGWSLRSGRYMFTFPEGTELYAKTPVTFANMTTGITDHSSLALHRPDNKIASVFASSEEDDTHVVSGTNYYPKKQKVEEVALLGSLSTSTNIDSPTSKISFASVISGENRPSWIYWVIGLGFLIVAFSIISMSKVFNSNRELEDEASKYTLVEIDSNLE